MIRQIEFALFDILIHKELNDCELLDDNQVYKKFLKYWKSLGEISVIKQPSFVLFPNSFSHIFDGGYAAGTTATNGQKFCPLIVTRVLKEKMIGKNQFRGFV